MPKPPKVLAYCAVGVFVITERKRGTLVYASADRAEVANAVRVAESLEFAVRVWQFVESDWAMLYDSVESRGLFV